VIILYGSAGGVTAVGSQDWYQGSDGILDEVEADDWYGVSLATIPRMLRRVFLPVTLNLH
jgi:hypothetical protein